MTCQFDRALLALPEDQRYEITDVLSDKIAV